MLFATHRNHSGPTACHYASFGWLRVYTKRLHLSTLAKIEPGADKPDSGLLDCPFSQQRPQQIQPQPRQHQRPGNQLPRWQRFPE